MSDYAEVIVLVEGQTEKIFIEKLLLHLLASRNVFLTPIIITKPGQKGGDVKFARVQNDIELHLKQRNDTWLTLFVDYYGIGSDWPGRDFAQEASNHLHKAKRINQATKEQVVELFGRHGAERRFIPYIAMHEFEALLFSDPVILADRLSVKATEIEQIIRQYGEPENIDDSPQTAPSKRLKKLSSGFRKTTTGISIAEAIGISRMRTQCPLFNEWLITIESLSCAASG